MIAHRLTCPCGATIARGTHTELINALKARDWSYDGHAALCLECQLDNED